MATLREELKTSKIQAAIVCPGEVDTNIVNSVYQGDTPPPKKEEKVDDKDPREMLEVAADDAQGKSFPISPLQAAEAIFQGIENNDFYILLTRVTRSTFKILQMSILLPLIKQNINKNNQ